MNKKTIICLCFHLVFTLLFSKSIHAERHIYTFNLDTNIYKSVKIGKQEWMSQNLDVAFFRNGDSIKEVFSADEWDKAANEKIPAFIFYSRGLVDNEQIECSGKFYNWYAVIDPRGLAPLGWHVPNVAEWQIMIDYTGGFTYAGKTNKSISGWKNKKMEPQGNGTNSSGFNALPVGIYYTKNGKGYFDFVNMFSSWWTTESKNNSDAWLYFFSCEGDGSGTAARRKSSGIGVRCIKD